MVQFPYKCINWFNFPYSNDIICDIGTNEEVEARHHDIADVLKLDASGKSLLPGNSVLLDIGF